MASVTLDEAETAPVFFDEHGNQLNFELMEPLSLIQDERYFGNGLESDSSLVHVLVVVPEDFGRKRQKTEGIIDTQLIISDQIDEFRAVVAIFQQMYSKTDLATGKLVTTPDTLLGIDLKNGLYIVQEYWDLHNIIQTILALDDSFCRVLVIGSPGIGKSVFGVFLLLLFMIEKKDVAYRPLNKRICFFRWSSAKGYEISMSPLEGRKYEALFDGNDSSICLQDPIFRKMFLFASPSRENYNEFVKDNCFKVVMNPWTKDECQRFVDASHLEDEGEWFHRYNFLGGKPRFVFSLTETFEQLTERVMAEIPYEMTHLKNQIRDYKLQISNEQMTHMIFTMYRSEYNPSVFDLGYSSLVVETILKTRIPSFVWTSAPIS